MSYLVHCLGNQWTCYYFSLLLNSPIQVIEQRLWWDSPGFLLASLSMIKSMTGKPADAVWSLGTLNWGCTNLFNKLHKMTGWPYAQIMLKSQSSCLTSYLHNTLVLMPQVQRVGEQGCIHNTFTYCIISFHHN